MSGSSQAVGAGRGPGAPFLGLVLLGTALGTAEAPDADLTPHTARCLGELGGGPNPSLTSHPACYISPERSLVCGKERDPRNKIRLTLWPDVRKRGLNWLLKLFRNQAFAFCPHTGRGQLQPDRAQTACLLLGARAWIMCAAWGRVYRRAAECARCVCECGCACGCEVFAGECVHDCVSESVHLCGTCLCL